jgi:hypothetical protein
MVPTVVMSDKIAGMGIIAGEYRQVKKSPRKISRRAGIFWKRAAKCTEILQSSRHEIEKF